MHDPSGAGFAHAAGPRDRGVRGRLLRAVRAGAEPVDQRPVARAPRRRAAPGGVHGLLLLLPRLPRRQRGAQRVAPVPAHHGRRAGELHRVRVPPGRRRGQGARDAGGDGVRARERLHVHGGAGGRVRRRRLRAGAAARQHLLGRRAVRRVPPVVKTHVHAAGQHAAHVHRRHGPPHGFLQPQEAALTDLHHQQALPSSTSSVSWARGWICRSMRRGECRSAAWVRWWGPLAETELNC